MTNDRNRLRENKDYDAFLSFHGVEFGLMEGTDGLLVVKTGSGGTIYGHENKYLTLAARIAERHNVSVIVSDNPLELAPEENMSITMSVAADYISSRKEEMPVSYFGVSKGGQYGAMYGYRYPFVQKWLLLNLPVMINWHKSRAGLMKMSEEQEVTMIFGERDPSYPYAELIDLMRKENIKRVTIPNEDHTFSHAIDEFLRLPEQFLFP